MALDLTTLQLSTEPTRSAIELARRMMLLRWSVGKYLTTVVGNYGLGRPPLGFADDEFFRATAQALMADFKAIPWAFWQLIEIALGPYENLVFELQEDASKGDSYITLSPEIEFATYTNWNATPFIHNEVIDNGAGAEARFRYLDTQDGKIHFVERVGGPFAQGDTLTGQTSGGTVDLTADARRPVTDPTHQALDRLPLYGIAEIEKGTVDEETVNLVTVDRYRRRARLRTPLDKDHNAGDVLFLAGGCWELLWTQARRLVIKVKCEQLTRAGLPGNSYVHLLPWREARLRTAAAAGATTLELDDSVVSSVPTGVIKVIIDPEDEGDGVLIRDTVSYNPTTRTFTLNAGQPIPAGRRYIAGTRVRWVQRDDAPGGLTNLAVINQIFIACACRFEDVIGHWIIDEGGPNEELVFVTGTTYQRRQLTTNITPTTLLFGIDRPFDGIPEGTPASNLLIRVYDTTGYLGFVPVSSVFWYDPPGNTAKLFPQLGLAAAPGFSTNIAARPTYVELVLAGATGDVWLWLSRGLQIQHLIGESVQRWYGTTPSTPTYASHSPEGGWPPPAQPSGRWPGPNVFDPSNYAPARIRSTSVSSIYATAHVDDADPDDLRIYMASQGLAEKYNPATAAATLGIQTVTLPGPVVLQFQPFDVQVEDASYFPTTTQVQNWRASVNNPNPGFPSRVILGGEGGFGRTPLYYWGKAGGSSNTIYVSGIQRIHLPGTLIATYHEEIPIKAATGVIATGPGFPPGIGRAILDHTSEGQEILFYDDVKQLTPTTGYFEFERGFVPDHNHDPFRVSNIDPNEVIGVPIVRTERVGLTLPRRDGYSFSAFLPGNALLIRLAWLLQQVRAAGVQVTFYDENDKVIQIPVIF